MTRAFDPEYMATYFDRYGEAEWERHERSPSARPVSPQALSGAISSMSVTCRAMTTAPSTLSSVTGAPVRHMTDDEWAQFVSFELRLCREPGVLDGGTHLLAAVRVTEGSAS